MQKTIQIKLLPNKFQKLKLNAICKEYIQTVNTLVDQMKVAEKSISFTSKDVDALLPSAVKNQCCRDAKSIYKKHTKGITKTLAVLKRPVCIWNNQNFTFDDNSIAFPIWLTKSTRIKVKAIIPLHVLKLLENHKLGTLRITKKNHKYIAQITYETEETMTEGTNIMGIDLGIKVPAVCITSDNKVKFIGNGRENRYIRRRFKTKRQLLGKAKKLNAIKKLNNKEQRIMQDKDHKYSKQIIDFAIQNNVSVIKLETLAGIRKQHKKRKKYKRRKAKNKTRKSRKNNNNNVHSWSFYRLTNYIAYKAQLVGIQVEFVNPAYTSKTCPSCGTVNSVKDRNYKCSCGYHSHRDLVGAINILTAPMISGNSLSA